MHQGVDERHVDARTRCSDFARGGQEEVCGQVGQEHLRCRVQGWGLGGEGSGFRVQGSGVRVQGSGLRIQGSGFRVQGSGFRAEG